MEGIPGDIIEPHFPPLWAWTCLECLETVWSMDVMTMGTRHHIEVGEGNTM